MLHTARAAPTGRRGNITVWVIVCLSVIVGIVALGMDGGRMMEERRHAQAAADAAALAAATDLYYNYTQNMGTDGTGSAQSAALASAAANGYANDGVTSTVTVNIPPQSGTFAGRVEYAEVIVQSSLPGSFSALFTQGPLPVQARAVAHGAPKKMGLLLLQPAGPGALTMSDDTNVQVISAPIVADSPDPNVYQITGNASVSAAYHDLTSTVAPAGNIYGGINTSVPPTSDPLASLPTPADPITDLQLGALLTITGGSVTLQPGIYPTGINVSGTGAVTLMPGVYVLAGGLQVSGSGSVTGTGVLLYNTGGWWAQPISITGNGTITLSAPTDGTYQGISVFQDRNITLPVQFTGNAVVQIAGTVYAPAATVQLSGNSNVSVDTPGLSIIAYALQASGNGQATVSQPANRPRVPDIFLAE